jgi:porin
VPWGRPPLTRDWGGLRSDLAERGITFGIDLVNINQGVIDGGLSDGEWENGGSLYIEIQADLDKLLGWPGAFLEVRGETLYGESANMHSGSVLGVNNVALFPDPNESSFIVSKVLLTQFLSESFAVFAGRYDTADGDATHFSGGRGRTQFMNPAMVWSPTNARTSPYVLMGAGAIALLPNPFIERPVTFAAGIGDPQVAPNESGLDSDFFDEQYYWFESQFPTKFAQKPGNQIIGANLNTKNVIDLSDLPKLILPPLTPDRQDDSWVFYYNFHQYVYVEEGQNTDEAGYDAHQELLQGFGVFGRASFADRATNPIEQFYEIGVGGRGIFSGRDNDTYGLAVYKAVVSGRLNDFFDLLADEAYGFELFYNIEVSPWFHITPDFQIISPVARGVDTVYVGAVRARIDF